MYKPKTTSLKELKRQSATADGENLICPFCGDTFKDGYGKGTHIVLSHKKKALYHLNPKTWAYTTYWAQAASLKAVNEYSSNQSPG